jgi:hypothetical protein
VASWVPVHDRLGVRMTNRHMAEPTEAIDAMPRSFEATLPPIVQPSSGLPGRIKDLVAKVIKPIFGNIFLNLERPPVNIPEMGEASPTPQASSSMGPLPSAIE